MSNKAILEINGEKHELPTFTGSENEIAIDISSLRAVTKGVQPSIQVLKTRVLV